jgi:hypothetical protein
MSNSSPWWGLPRVQFPILRKERKGRKEGRKEGRENERVREKKRKEGRKKENERVRERKKERQKERKEKRKKQFKVHLNNPLWLQPFLNLGSVNSIVYLYGTFNMTGGGWWGIVEVERRYCCRTKFCKTSPS